MISTRKQTRAFWSLLGSAALLGLVACSGGDGGNTGNEARTGARAALTNIEYGRMVDVYAWRRRVPANADRLDPRGREPVLVERNVLVGPSLLNEDRFGNASARYRFLPYDPELGHRELLILYDNQHPDEGAAFNRALESARAGVLTVAPYYAFAQGVRTPPPLVPRDATLRLTFDRPLGLGTDFFEGTRGAVQILRLTGNPNDVDPNLAYQPVTNRVVSKNNGKVLLVDLEVSGSETGQNRNPNPAGLPESLDDKTANIRIALPTSGSLAKQFRVRVDSADQFNSVDLQGNKAVVRDFRAGNRFDSNNGHLPDVDDPTVVARKDAGILAINEAERLLTINKRFADLVLRGRLPFADGPVDPNTGLPTGPDQDAAGTCLPRG